MSKSLLLAALFSGLVASVAIAHADGKQRPRCPPPPPKEAVEACAQKASGDDCSFETPDGDDVSGTCWKPSDAPDDAPLACAPAGVRGRGDASAR